MRAHVCLCMTICFVLLVKCFNISGVGEGGQLPPTFESGGGGGGGGGTAPHSWTWLHPKI